MKHLFSICLFLFSVPVFAQWGDEASTDKPSIRDKMFVGGGFGASFTRYTDFVSVSPIIGYKVSPRFAPGIGLQYRYTSYKGISPQLTTNDYGASLFARFKVFGPFFLHAEFEHLNYEFPGNSPGETLRKDFNSFLAGGGFFQPIGRKAGFFASALYNFSYQSSYNYAYYPYSSPLILRFGITAGF
ncbi:MAG: hypothetical protein JJE09_11860 [Bacteroidia bacterium]|nr:hypothetical protein [Bacteroidia bacterium]